jgi:hypothetical protein
MLYEDGMILTANDVPCQARQNKLLVSILTLSEMTEGSRCHTDRFKC